MNQQARHWGAGFTGFVVLPVRFRHVRLARVTMMDQDTVTKCQRLSRPDRHAPVAFGVIIEIVFAEGIHRE